MLSKCNFCTFMGACMNDDITGCLSLQVLAFLDLFAVNVINTPEDIRAAIRSPDQLCGLLPHLRLRTLPHRAMARLMGQTHHEPTKAAPDHAQGAYLSVPFNSSLLSTIPHGGQQVLQPKGAMPPGRQAALREPPVGHRPSPSSRQSPTQLEISKLYMAAHVRRGDWWYYCAGRRRCFYSASEVGRCLRDKMHRHGISSIYIATNADDRERRLLAEGIGGRVLFWSDVHRALLLLKPQTSETAAAATNNQSERFKGLHDVLEHPKPAVGSLGTLPDELQSSGGTGAIADCCTTPADSTEAFSNFLERMSVEELLRDRQAKALIEKALCAQSAFFYVSAGSSFSTHITDIRNGGVPLEEASAWFPTHEAPAVVNTTDLQPLPARHTRPGEAAAEPEVSICSGVLNPLEDDNRLLPETFNANLLLDRLSKWRQAAIDRSSWHSHSAEVAASALHQASSDHHLPDCHNYTHPLKSQRLDLSQALPARKSQGPSAAAGAPVTAAWLQRFAVALADADALAAANRFVGMYMSPRFAALHLGRRPRMLQGSGGTVQQLADCVGLKLRSAGLEVSALFVDLLNSCALLSPMHLCYQNFEVCAPLFFNQP